MPVTIEVSSELKVICEKCGDELSATIDYNINRPNELSVEPCDNCLDKKTKESYDEGYADGEETAMSKFEQLN